MVKILVSDYDGTLKMPAPVAVSEQLLADLRHWETMGNQLWLATGRSAISIQKEQEQYPFNFQYLIGCNGSFICDRQYRVLSATIIDQETVRGLLAFVAGIVCDSVVVTSGLQRVQVKVEHIASDIALRELVETGRVVQIVVNFIEDHPMIDQYQKAISERFNLNPLRNNRCLDIVSRGTDKQTGIEFLLSYLKIYSPQAIVCVGDGENDVCMLQHYRGYLMANARPHLLSKFSRQVTSVSQLIAQEIKEQKGEGE